MMSGSAPSSIGQLSTNSVLKKTPKKKRGRAKRSLKEFERGKPSDSGPSPKFRRVGKTAKEDDKNNRKRKIKWNVEPHYTVMRKAVGLALDGQSTTRVAQEFGIPARTLRRYVATAKKANGLPETAATDRPTHAPSKKKKSSMKSESGFFGSLNRLEDEYESYDSEEEEDDVAYGRVRSNSLDMLLAAADKSDHESPSLLPNESSGFAAPASAHVSWADDAMPEKSSPNNNISFTSRPERSGSLDLFFQALGSDLRNGDKRGRSDNRGMSFDVPALVRDQIAKSVTTPEKGKGRPRNNSLWSPTLTIT